MHEQNMAILRALVPVAWADGEFAAPEKEALDALLEAYGANEAEKAEVRAFAAEKKTIDDIQLQDLSADDRRVLLQHATLMSYADGRQTADEVAFLEALAAKLRIPIEEANSLVAAAGERAKNSLKLL